jgi:CRISPR/Cas system-associated endonuclease Cas1
MLIYAYAVLESQVRIATVSQSLDAAIDYLHACRPGQVALVYDLIETLRLQVDQLVRGFLRWRHFETHNSDRECATRLEFCLEPTGEAPELEVMLC